MVEEVFSEDCETHTIRVCRDGRVMIRIESLEAVDDQVESIPIEETVKRWGDYLDYLNSYYLLLDSSTIEISNLGYFSLHEITNRDAFRVRYENGKSVGENIAAESIASVFQMGRYSSSYRQDVPIEYDSKIIMRQVISIDVIRHASAKFAEVVATPGLQKMLSSFAKSLSEYKVGNYETSIVLAWFITEEALSKLWQNHIEELNETFDGGRSRINRDRKDFLTGRDFTISAISNLLELWGIIPFEQFQEIDKVRGYRNKIVHSLGFVPGANESQLALNTAKSMIGRIGNVDFTPNMVYSVSGL
tara:strand:+ start:184 stop:1095 length:912 start_codon:yes stop_codon:yes gene_type:complete